MSIWFKLKVGKLCCLVYQSWNKLIVKQHKKDWCYLICHHWKYRRVLSDNTLQWCSHFLHICQEWNWVATSNNKHKKNQSQDDWENTIVEIELSAVQCPFNIRGTWCFLVIPTLCMWQTKTIMVIVLHY